MLLDLWNFAIIVNDLVEFVVYCVDSSSFYVTFPFLVLSSLFLVVCLVAWRSTNIPDIPPPPSPPYVIQIQGNGGERSRGRQTLSDIRILSSGPYVESVLRRLPQQQQNLPQQGLSNRDSEGTTAIERGQRTPSSLFFGLLRRPIVPPIIPVRPSVRSRFITPNLIVYHRVNVYHHNSGPNRNLNDSRGANRHSDNSNTSSATSVTPLVRIEENSLPDTDESIQEQSELQNLQSQNDRQPSLEITDLGESRLILENSDIVVPDLPPSVSGLQIQHENSQVEVEVHTEEEIALIETEEPEDLEIESDGELAIVEPSLSLQNLHQSPASLRLRNTRDVNDFVDSNSDISNQHHIVTAKNQQDKSVERTRKAFNQPTETEETMEPEANCVRFTIKFLNDTQMDVTSQYNEKIADFKRRHFATEMSENKVVRLIFNGRVLDNDSKTLQESGIFDQCVVHCLIVARQSPVDGRSNLHQSPYPGRGSGIGIRGRGPEPGMFFVSIMGIILIFLWFICFHFGQQLFTQSAIVSLTVLTAIFLIGLVAFYLPIHPNN